VHREAREKYAELAAELEALVADAQRALAGDGEVPIAFNASPFPVDGVPALGAGPMDGVDDEVWLEPDAGITMENGRLRVRVDERGLLVSVHDKRRDREVLAGPANLLQLHPDTPNRFDAWDIEAHYTNRVCDVVDLESLDATVLPGGAAEVTAVRRAGASRFVQRIRLEPSAGRVAMQAEVDWQHDETLLKVAFPLAVHAERSTSEIGYGHVHRATHTNTGWDAARFEICAHRWIQVEEPGYGVALVNSTTYGHDVSRPASGDRRGAGPTTVRLSLVRGPRFPDPDTDRGSHRFEYALVADADVPTAVEEGYRANLPLRHLTGSGARVEPVLRVLGGTGVVEAVKLAEDRSGDVVVRVYEASGGRTVVRLAPGFEHSGVMVTDLHEQPDDECAALAPLTVTEEELSLPLGPFQIVTLRFATPTR